MTSVLVTQLTNKIERDAYEIKFPNLNLTFLPLIHIEPILPGPQETRWLNEADCLIFTSKSAVRFCDHVWPNKLKTLSSNTLVAAVGEKTKKELRARGVKKIVMPEAASTSKHLAEELLNKYDLKDKKSVYLRAKNGQRDLLDLFESHHIPIKAIDLYETKTDHSQKEKLKTSITANYDWVVFSSPSAIKAMINLLTIAEVALIKKHARIATLGKTTTQCAQEHGLEISIQSKIPNLEKLLSELTKPSSKDPKTAKKG